MPDDDRERVVEDASTLHRPLQRLALSYQTDDTLAVNDKALDMLKAAVERTAARVSVHYHDRVGWPRQQSQDAGKGSVVLVGLLRGNWCVSEEPALTIKIRT